jgi:choline-sulfatase
VLFIVHSNPEPVYAFARQSEIINRLMQLLRFCAAIFLAGPAMAADPHPPVILISIDTLRADHLSAYGYRHIATPNIDSIASGGTLFTDIACQTPLTLPSHNSLFTSTYPFQNHIQENAEPVPPGTVTLASVLKSHGYKTAAFISSVFLEREMGLDQGFDTYDSPFHFEAFSPVSGEMFFGGPSNSYAVHEQRDGALTIHAAIRWLAANGNQPVFVFIHLFDLHTPYSVPERKGVSRYDAQLLYEDELIGRLKGALVQQGWWDKAFTILFSDHGEGLGEHGERSHGYFIYQSTLHVPLMIHWPLGFAAPGLRVSQPAGLIDIAPTILDLLHLPKPPSFEGSSLMGGSSHTTYSESLHTHDSFGWAPLRSVRMGDYKYIEAPKPELYNLKDDPAERNNIAFSHPIQAGALRLELSKLIAKYTAQSHSAPQATSPQTENLLASLGYLSRGPQGRSSKSMPDPKDRLAEFRLYEKAIEMIAERQLADGLTLLLQVLTEDPDNKLARRDLAACYLELHNYPKARTNFAQVVRAAPDDYPSQFGLGLAAKHLGLFDEARIHLEAACHLAPHASQCKHELDTLAHSQTQ